MTLGKLLKEVTSVQAIFNKMREYELSIQYSTGSEMERF